MAILTDKQLGVYWGSEGLYFLVSQAGAPTKTFHFPFGEASKETIKKGPLSTPGIALVAEIKNIVRKNGIAESSVNLSLPTRDIIFRSFVIPWMQDHEVKNVVEFEAAKYIPFSLDKLSYSFHATSFMENNTRRIRVIFVAIKSDTLRSYVRFLEDSTMHVQSIEPSASSLIRVLSAKNLIPKDQTFAIVEKEEVGRIVVVDQEVPQFAREFHLGSMGAIAPTPDDPDALIKKMTGEVRISLDYFNRQSETLQVKQIYLLSASRLEEFSSSLEKTLSIPISAIELQSVLHEPSKSNLGFLNAYGASIIATAGLAQHFEFAKHKTEKAKQKMPLVKKPISPKSLIKTALVCTSLIMISIIVAGLWTQKLKKDIGTISQELGKYRESDITVIEKNEMRLTTKLTNFKKVRMHSEASSALALVPGLLPDGVWVENIEIAYDDSAVFAQTSSAAQTRRFSQPTKTEKAPAFTVTISGYAYSEDRNEQFLLVNLLLRNLKKSAEFASMFGSIDLETTEAQKILQHVNIDEEPLEYPVTAYKIVCTKDHGPDQKTQ